MRETDIQEQKHTDGDTKESKRQTTKQRLSDGVSNERGREIGT